MFGFKKSEETESNPASESDPLPGLRVLHFTAPGTQNSARPFVFQPLPPLAEFIQKIEADAGFGVEIEDEDDDATVFANSRHVFDLSHEAVRIYHVVDTSLDEGVREIEVENPVSLTIAPDGSHEITCHDRSGFIIPPKWFLITVLPLYGNPVFPGHIPVNEIETGDEAGC